MIGPEGQRQFQAARDAVDDDHLADPPFAGHGDGVEPQSAGSLDDQAVFGPGPTAFESVDDLGQGTVGRAGQFVGHVVGNLEDGLPGTQVVVLSVGGGEVGILVGWVAVLEPLGTTRRRVASAAAALATTNEVLENHAIADGQRLTGRIGGEAIAQFVHHAGHLVPDRQAERLAVASGDVVGAPPDVQVAATDIGQGDPHDGGPRLGLGHRKFHQRERPSHPGERRHQSCFTHDHSPAVVAMVIGRWMGHHGERVSSETARPPPLPLNPLKPNARIGRLSER